MADESFSDRLKRLEDRIAAAKARRAPRPRGHGDLTQGSLAWRMVIELVVGMVLGLAIGWGLDALLRHPAGVPGDLRAARLRRRRADDAPDRRTRCGAAGARRR